MSKIDSKTRYKIRINVPYANALRKFINLEPIPHEDMETLANQLAEIVNASKLYYER